MGRSPSWNRLVPVLALLVSIASAAALARNRIHREIGMDTPDVSARLTTVRGRVQEIMEVTPESVRLTSEEPSDDLLPTVSFEWKGRFLTPTLDQKLRTVNAADHATDREFQHRLLVSGGGRQVAVSWDSERTREAADLRALREELQRLAGLRFEEAKRSMALADGALARPDLDQAILQLKRGLRVLGTMYASQASRDSTGMRLAAADGEVAQGHKDQAAALLRNALETRLEIYVAPPAPPSEARRRR
jgi:hypothetical protein